QALAELADRRHVYVRLEPRGELLQAVQSPYGADTVFQEPDAVVRGVQRSLQVTAGESRLGQAAGPYGLVPGSRARHGGLQGTRRALHLPGAQQDLALGRPQLPLAEPVEPVRVLLRRVTLPEGSGAVQCRSGLVVVAAA